MWPKLHIFIYVIQSKTYLILKCNRVILSPLNTQILTTARKGTDLKVYTYSSVLLVHHVYCRPLCLTGMHCIIHTKKSVAEGLNSIVTHGPLLHTFVQQILKGDISCAFPGLYFLIWGSTGISLYDLQLKKSHHLSYTASSCSPSVQPLSETGCFSYGSL